MMSMVVIYVTISWMNMDCHAFEAHEVLRNSLTCQTPAASGRSRGVFLPSRGFSVQVDLCRTIPLQNVWSCLV